VLVDSLPPVVHGLDLLADCGRLEPRPVPSVSRLLAASALTVVVVRPTFSPLLRLAERLPEIRTLGDPVVALLCGASPYPMAQIEDELGVPVIGHLPADAAAAAMLRGEEGFWRRTHRLPLFRAAAAAAARIAALVANERAEQAAPLAKVTG
jgi:hypothetical protein